MLFSSKAASFGVGERTSLTDEKNKTPGPAAYVMPISDFINAAELVNELCQSPIKAYQKGHR